MIPIFRIPAALAALLAITPAAMAETSPTGAELGISDGVLASQGEAVLTQAEIDAAFSKVPAEHRLPFIRNGERVNLIVRQLLRNKLLVEEARNAGFAQTPLMEKRLQLAMEKELADAWLLHVINSAPEADYETLAHEAWLADPDAWRTEESVDVSHILVGSEERSTEEALQLAQELRERLDEDPSQFGELVMEYSDDPSKVNNRGRFTEVKRNAMVKPFEDAAFAMQDAGEITAPVETDYGFHLIRLDARHPSVVRPFEKIKEEAMEQARAKYLNDYRSQYMRKLLADPIDVSQDGVEEMVKRYFGENLELAPDFME